MQRCPSRATHEAEGDWALHWASIAREAPADAARSVRQFNRLPPVRGTDAKPAVAHLVIVNARIIELHRQAQTSRRKASNRGQHIVGSDHPIVLRGYEVDAGD